MASTSIDPIQEQQVAAYLSEHADFFARHPQILTTLYLPHATGGATSLFDRQVRQLREQNQHYRTQLTAWLQVAHENEAMAQRLHQLTLTLMQLRCLDDLLQTLPGQVQTVFQADAVAIKLFDAATLHAQSGPIVGRFDTFLRQVQPSCGPISATQSDYLFASRVMRSVVVLPLQSTDQVGILAIGSHDEARFHAQQGMDFLRRFNDIVNAVLQQARPSDTTAWSVGERHVTLSGGQDDAIR